MRRSGRRPPAVRFHLRCRHLTALPRTAGWGQQETLLSALRTRGGVVKVGCLDCANPRPSGAERGVAGTAPVCNTRTPDCACAVKRYIICELICDDAPSWGVVMKLPRRELLSLWRQLCSLVVSSLLFGLVIMRAAPAQADGMVYDEDRRGGDYTNMPLGTPQQCQAACAKDQKCRAWSWFRGDHFQPPSPVSLCFLKDSVPAGQLNLCCVSGVIDRSGPSILRVLPGLEDIVPRITVIQHQGGGRTIVVTDPRGTVVRQEPPVAGGDRTYGGDHHEEAVREWSQSPGDDPEPGKPEDIPKDIPDEN
jgi:hypothetical protein